MFEMKDVASSPVRKAPAGSGASFSVLAMSRFPGRACDRESRRHCYFMRNPPRLFAGVLLAPTANHVISAGKHEKAETRAGDRAGRGNGNAATAIGTAGGLGKSGRCGQGEERRRRKQSN